MSRSGRWVARTLRTRLTVTLVSVLLAVSAVTGAVTAVSLRSFLLARLDAQLAAAGGRFSQSLQDGRTPASTNDGDADNAVPGQPVGTLGVRLVNGRVTQSALVDGQGVDRTVSLDAADVAALGALTGGGPARSIRLQRVGDYRLKAVAGRDGDTQITGLPLHEVDETVTRLVTVEGSLFALAILVSAGVTVLLVGRALRPLRRVAETALHVSGLPLTDPGTRLPGGIAPADPTTEVDQVSVAFDRMLDHVRRALLARDLTEQGLRRFVADASHELRTPLATIRAHAEYATRAGDPLPESATTSFQRIDTAAVRMAVLVDDLLLLARLDAGRPLARDTVDLTQLAVEAVADARTTSPDHRWRLELPDEPIETTGDGDRLHQVVTNLLANARVHTPPGTTVTTAVTRTSIGSRVTVTDDGPGVPPELMVGLFDRFARGDPSRTRGHGSTGLGLAIAHSIATAHQGALTVDSRPGHTCFRLDLPARHPEAPRNAPRGASALETVPSG